MTEKIKFKAANPPKIMKYNDFAHSAFLPYLVNTGGIQFNSQRRDKINVSSIRC